MHHLTATVAKPAAKTEQAAPPVKKTIEKKPKV
jgi:hypothetical protein